MEIRKNEWRKEKVLLKDEGKQKKKNKQNP